MAEWPGTGELRDWQAYQRDWVEANNACRHDILDRLRADGPLAGAASCPTPACGRGGPSGWNDNKNVAIMLDLLVQRGEVAVAGRRGRERLWDLASRVYPDDPPVPAERGATAARRAPPPLRSASRGRAARTARSSRSTSATPVSRQWSRASAASGGSTRRSSGTPFSGRAALLSPLDRLLHDRKRMNEVFEFDYILEMYKPAASGAGATTRCRSCTATGWSESSTPRPIARPASCASPRSTRTSRSPRR